MRLWRALCGQRPQYSERNHPPTQLNGRFHECEPRLATGERRKSSCSGPGESQLWVRPSHSANADPDAALRSQRAAIGPAPNWQQVISNGETRCDALEQRLAGACDRRVDNHARRHANGAPHPEASAYARMFSGKYEHRLISGGIGHNLPQEAPEAFARGHHRRERNVIRARQSATAS